MVTIKRNGREIEISRKDELKAGDVVLPKIFPPQVYVGRDYDNAMIFLSRDSEFGKPTAFLTRYQENEIMLHEERGPTLLENAPRINRTTSYFDWAPEFVALKYLYKRCTE